MIGSSRTRATIDLLVSKTQTHRVTIGVMTQHKDNANQAHRDMRLATVMKRINKTQKVIVIKMTMWERMGDVPTKDGLFLYITSLIDKVEDLNTQLEAICVLVTPLS